MKQKSFLIRLFVGGIVVIILGLILFAIIISHTAAPTVTISPTSSTTTTRIYSPQPTSMPTFTPTITRQEATFIPISEETPTPIFTPSVGAADFQLRKWDEGKALDLIDLADQFSFADNIPWFSDTRPNYQDDQAVVILAAQEAVHRFPGANFSEKLKWRIALANTIMDKPDSDARMMQQIEDCLNSRRFTPDTLDQMLNPFGFQIGQQESAFNLFGDNQPAQVILFTRQDRGYNGLYAALHQDTQGHFTLTKIYSTWSYDYGSDYSTRTENYFEVGDHTGDNVPEVILYPGYHNGTFCGYKLVIFQWEGDRFADLSRDQFTFDVCNSFPHDWAYGPANEQGTETIVTWRGVGFFPTVTRHDSYVWNGKWYELSESQIESPDKLTDRNASLWVVYAMNWGDYSTVIDKITASLSDESQLQTLAANLGPSYPDYLRFQLGLAYGFQSETEQARTAFSQIITQPYNPAGTALVQAAQAYLDGYQSDADSYRACQSALEVMQKALSQPLSSAAETYDFQEIEKAWGYKPDESWDSLALCNLNAAFYKVVEPLNPDQFGNAPEELKKAGVRVRTSIAKDLTNDRQAEWILLVNTPGDDVPLNLWILIKTPTRIVAVPLVDWERKQYDLPTHGVATAVLNVQTVLSPDRSTITFIRAGDYLYTFGLDENPPAIDYVLWQENYVESYGFYQGEKGLMLDVTINTNHCPHCKSTYQWSDGRFDRLYPGEPDPSVVDQAEAALLEQWNSDKAIPLLLDILSYPNYRDTPRTMYMLGLAYELTVDQDQAILTYWKLWHNNPESPYALLAKAKLELRKSE